MAFFKIYDQGSMISQKSTLLTYGFLPSLFHSIHPVSSAYPIQGREGLDPFPATLTQEVGYTERQTIVHSHIHLPYLWYLWFLEFPKVERLTIQSLFCGLIFFCCCSFHKGLDCL